MIGGWEIDGTCNDCCTSNRHCYKCKFFWTEGDVQEGEVSDEVRSGEDDAEDVADEDLSWEAALQGVQVRCMCGMAHHVPPTRPEVGEPCWLDCCACRGEVDHT